ncbi:hypothetical protein [Sphingomonas sp. T1]|uniref:hypothetical protein n=1 Tax=Sphingomonas sp. T1 TaxID=2653172 RepID=UPI0013587657|nr:hypothetical protein [Sphingomonas sp. T1]
MAELSLATSPSFVSKAESVSNLTNVYGLKTLGAGHPAPGHLRYFATGASILELLNLTEEGCLPEGEGATGQVSPRQRVMQTAMRQTRRS